MKIKISDYELGFWKIESIFDRGYFIHSKCYIEETENKITAKPANLIQYSTSGIYKQTPFEDIENLLDDDDSKPMSLMLNQYYNQNSKQNL